MKIVIAFLPFLASIVTLATADQDAINQCAVDEGLASCFSSNGCSFGTTGTCSEAGLVDLFTSCSDPDCNCLSTGCSTFTSTCCPACGQTVEQYFECALGALGLSCNLERGSDSASGGGGGSTDPCASALDTFVGCGSTSNCDLTGSCDTNVLVADIASCSGGDCNCANQACTSFFNTCCSQCGQAVEDYIQCLLSQAGSFPCDIECGSGGGGGSAANGFGPTLSLLVPLLACLVL